MIREDRVLLTELARINSDVAPLALRMMDESATPEDQRVFAERLMTMGRRLHRRADEMERVVIEGEILVEKAVAFPVDGDTVTAHHQDSL